MSEEEEDTGVRPTTLNLSDDEDRPERRHYDRRSASETRTRSMLHSPLVAAIIAALIAALFSWANGVSGLASRVTTLEANRSNDAARMERIENKVDEILERLAK